MELRSGSLATLPLAVEWVTERFAKFDSYETVRRSISAAHGYSKCLIDNEGVSTIIVIVADPELAK
jgi:hypothetical protein